jgi:hypothetical protein
MVTSSSVSAASKAGGWDGGVVAGFTVAAAVDSAAGVETSAVLRVGGDAGDEFGAVACVGTGGVAIVLAELESGVATADTIEVGACSGSDSVVPVLAGPESGASGRVEVTEVGTLSA